MPNAGVFAKVFRSPLGPGQAVGTLFLIENSEPMKHIWPHLRVNYYHELLGAMRMANPTSEIKVLQLTSFPASEDSRPAVSAPSRQYNNPPEILFNPLPQNRISTSVVRRGIQLLSSAFLDRSAARHMILMAASGPADDFDHTALAQELSLAGIICHIISRPEPRTEIFANLFNLTLHLQADTEMLPWYPTDPPYQLYLSSRLPRSPPSQIKYDPLPPALTRTQDKGPYTHPPLLRNYTYPPDVPMSAPLSESIGPSDEQNSPNIVSQLQTMHGLTKKRVQGAPSTRGPFFRTDPPTNVRDKYRQIRPSKLSIPPASTKSQASGYTTRDGRVSSRSKADRPKRDKAPYAAPIVRSRVSTPENETPLSSPVSPATFSGLSPMAAAEVGSHYSGASSPVTPSGDYMYPAHVSTLSDPTAALVSSSTVSQAETAWIGNAYPSYPSPPTVIAPSPPSLDAPRPALIPQSRRVQHYPPSDVAQVGASSVNAGPLFYASSVDCAPAPIAVPPPSSGAGAVAHAKDDGDRPFIFCPELEAENAAQMEIIKRQYALPRPPSRELILDRPHAPYAMPPPAATSSLPSIVPYAQDAKFVYPPGVALNTQHGQLGPAPYANTPSSLHGWGG
ncbi:hypothetical protein PLICRDRAFT_343541 [Plicaturopsis crispa FD-325 SS-3]|uniref:Uncharacterized protein n=1 Tax=Plicaturopsis crispa FD-325 SS-3 TaxID=944288 RepID=A0A0C9T679_PLICR|nr:hypothetical protein PLICRDRAFT_343541 [Plicaturopsis crispa FD-325 SS-3]